VGICHRKSPRARCAGEGGNVDFVCACLCMLVCLPVCAIEHA
jgi:hypothetical protein